jgi:hypothetical protein
MLPKIGFFAVDCISHELAFNFVFTDYSSLLQMCVDGSTFDTTDRGVWEPWTAVSRHVDNVGL